MKFYDKSEKWYYLMILLGQALIMTCSHGKLMFTIVNIMALFVIRKLSREIAEEENSQVTEK